MQNLIRFFVRFRLLFLFILLEGLALSWMFSSRSFQRSTYLNSSRAVNGVILTRYDALTDYLNLAKQNEQLAKENAALRSLTKDAYLPVYTTPQTSEDTLYKVRYQYISAQVINSSFRKRQNYMTINRGSAHGIAPQMGVIGPKGVVGEVKEVSEHFATVIPLINPTLAISGRLKHTGFFGPVKWEGADYRMATVSDIPRYAQVSHGDSIVTDGRSLIFPAGIPIGTVTEYSIQDDKNFYTLLIELSTDFSSVDHVYVVLDKFKTEILNLQQSP